MEDSLTTWFDYFCCPGYEFEVSYDTGDYTGWYRCKEGRLADGRWPNWHTDGRKRYQ